MGINAREAEYMYTLALPLSVRVCIWMPHHFSTRLYSIILVLSDSAREHYVTQVVHYRNVQDR